MQDKLALLSLSIAIGGLIVGAFVIYLTTKQERQAREMQHRERMAALEKGIDLPLAEIGTCQAPEQPAQSGAARTGIGDRARAARPRSGPFGLDVGLLAGMLGIAMLAHWFVRGRHEWDRDRALSEELRRVYIERLRTAG